MDSRIRTISLLIVALTVFTVLPACGATPTPTPTQALPTALPTQVPSTKAPPTATKAPVTATPVPPTPTPAPATGGKLVFGMNQEPDTLDPQLSNRGAMWYVWSNLGDSLIARDPITGKYVPSLAQSWVSSTDGMTLTFKLRKDVKWQDGTPFTANDYEFTINRALDPATKSVGTGPMLAAAKSAKAVDDYTLDIYMKLPFYPIFVNLAVRGYLSPLPKAYFQQVGAEKFARNPMGEGPYKFVSWQTGTSILLQRNPDYKWGPAYVKGPYLDTIEFRVVPDSATIGTGMESGDLDLAKVNIQDLSHLQATKQITILKAVDGGNPGFALFNQSLPLFQNLTFKKALAMTVDRKQIVQAVYAGDATEMYGPITKTTAGYDPVQETYGYKLDVAGAKALLQQDGWVAGSDGVLAKGTQSAKFTLTAWAGMDPMIRLAQVLQQQWKAIGVQADIQQLEIGVAVANVVSGKYECSLISLGYPDWDVFPMIAMSNKVGGGGYLQLDDATFDQLCLATRSTMDDAGRQAAVNAAAQYMMQNVFMISFAAAPTCMAVNDRFKGVIYSELTGDLSLLNAFAVK